MLPLKRLCECYFSGALAYSELGTLVPRSGSEYAYFIDSFGPLHKFWGHLPAFIYSWIMIMVIRPAEIAVLTLTFSQYFCEPILDALCVQNNPDVKENVIKIVALIALGKHKLIYIYIRTSKCFFFCFKESQHI